MFDLSSGIKREFCFNCEKTCLHIVEYSRNKPKAKRVCLLCKHISYWNISVYPHPKKDTNKQVDYIAKDVEGFLNSI